ncbi:MAG: hypothetical protein QOH81_1644 [Sphingomonadales bacterium]|nr:hypothetical protein [Sphingomonadales bacterium]
MRARLLIAADAVGGVWQYSLELAREVAGLGFEPVLAVLGPAPSAAQRRQARGLRLIDTGLPLDWLAEDAAELLLAARGLRALAVREQADIVQVPSGALLAGASLPMPTVAVQHSCVATWWQTVRGTALPRDFAWRAERVGAGLGEADAVVAPTAAFAGALSEIYGPVAIRAVHNGRRPFGLAATAPHDCVFTAGRLWDEGKDLRTLDAAAARLPVPVHAAGPTRGPNGAAIAFEAVHPLGELDPGEIGRWLAARPVFVSTALYEPFGLAVLEAAAAGCPLVLSDIATFRELWDGVAIFVPPGDGEGFAEAIAEIVGADALRHALGSAARERSALYRPRATAEKMAAIYDSLLGRIGRRSAAQPQLAGAA